MFKLKSGERRVRGSQAIQRSMLESIQEQLAACDAIDPLGYLEARRLVYVRALEQVVDEAKLQGNLHLVASTLEKLTRLSSLHKVRIDATIRPMGLQQSPKLAQLSEAELKRLTSAPDGDPIFAIEDQSIEPIKEPK